MVAKTCSRFPVPFEPMKRFHTVFEVFLRFFLEIRFFRLLLSRFFGVFFLTFSGRHSKVPLFFLFDLEEKLDGAINRLACETNFGIHPKHRVTRYHEFFLSHVSTAQEVLDLGCGNGAVAFTLASKKNCRVTAIDMNVQAIKEANKRFSHPGIHFVVGDATQPSEKRNFEVIILSNVLEHIEARIGFLKDIQSTYSPEKILVRVPNFERSWKIPFRKELGVSYFSDATHFIEHTPENFADEVKKAGLFVLSLEIKWGEIWAVLSSKTPL